MRVIVSSKIHSQVESLHSGLRYGFDSALETAAWIIGTAAMALTTSCTSHQAVTTYHYENLRTGWNWQPQRDPG
jgi:hypothetical protein